MRVLIGLGIAAFLLGVFGWAIYPIPTGQINSYGEQVTWGDYEHVLVALVSPSLANEIDKVAEQHQPNPNGPMSDRALRDHPHRAIITAYMFGMLFTGQPLSGVEEAFGPGNLLSSSSDGGSTFESYGWSNPDGSGIVPIFEDGRLVSKSQVGLPSD